MVYILTEYRFSTLTKLEPFPVIELTIQLSIKEDISDSVGEDVVEPTVEKSNKSIKPKFINHFDRILTTVTNKIRRQILAGADGITIALDSAEVSLRNNENRLRLIAWLFDNYNVTRYILNTANQDRGRCGEHITIDFK